MSRPKARHYQGEKHTGVVKWFNAEKGYGFITDHTGDHFVHWKGINIKGYKSLQADQEVDFYIETSEVSGRLHAVGVVPVPETASA